MEGLVAECMHLRQQAGEPEVLDALLLAGVQKVQSHQLSCEGTLCTWAEVLGFEQALILLAQNLAQQTRAHERLTALARDAVNLYAAEAR
jgi:ferritin-like metal-binding protein YciE